MDEDQVEYATFQALTIGEAFRALRVLHARRREVCTGCDFPIYSDVGDLDLICLHKECQDKEAFEDPIALLAHGREQRHQVPIAL